VTARRLGLLAIAAAAVVLPVSPAHASGLPPVTQPDAVTVTIDSREVHIDLAANDYDPEGEAVVYGGTDRNIPGVGIIDNTKRGGPQDVVVFASTFPRPGDTSPVVPGVYQVKTFMNDGSGTSASTLTITVLPSPGDAVVLTKKRRPGQVIVRNGNDVGVRFYWGAEGRRRADGFVDIPAHGAAKIQVLRRSLVTVVLAGNEYAVDARRHFKVPQDGTALPPGVEHGHGLLDIGLTKWVRRVTGT
jgi:hypothetical protein